MTERERRIEDIRSARPACSDCKFLLSLLDSRERALKEIIETCQCTVDGDSDHAKVCGKWIARKELE